MESSTLAAKFISDYKALYELYLLHYLAKDSSFYYEIAGPVLNTARTNSKKLRNDFSKPMDNKIYGYMKTYYDCSDKEETKEVPKLFLINVLRLEKDDDKITYDDYEIGKQRIEKIYEDLQNDFKPLISSGFEVWVKKRRAEVLAKSINENIGEVSLELISDMTQTEMDSLSTIKSGYYQFNDIIASNDDEEREREILIQQSRVSLGIPAFDDRLEGGMNRPELLILVVPSGGGKTVFCTQSAASVAMTGKKVLFISTEQEPKELFRRMISSLCNIPFRKVRDGIAKNLLTEEEFNRVLEVKDTLTENIKMLWWAGSDKTIEQNLESEIIKFKNYTGSYPDLLYFDWLGGGLMRGLIDMQKVNLNGLNSTRAMSTLCRMYDICGVLTVQADETSSKGKKEIGPECISMMKNIKRDADIGIGISALFKKSIDRKDGEDPYDPIQTCTMWKIRKKPTSLFTLRRDFDYQRFTKAKKTGQSRNRLLSEADQILNEE